MVELRKCKICKDDFKNFEAESMGICYNCLYILRYSNHDVEILFSVIDYILAPSLYK